MNEKVLFLKNQHQENNGIYYKKALRLFTIYAGICALCMFIIIKENIAVSFVTFI